MSLISELEYERNRYYKLRDDITEIYNCLTIGDNKFDYVDKQLYKYYNINDEQVIQNNLEKISENINNIKNVLNNNILIAINNRIAQLDTEIEQAQELSILGGG